MFEVTKTVILGAGPHAGVICDILRHDPTIMVVGFTDIEVDPANQEFHSLPILGTDQALGDLKRNHQADGLIAALGWELLPKRRQMFERGQILGYRFVKAVHPTAVLSTGAAIGEGTALCAGTVIGPYTKIGQHCVINTHASIDHDCVIGDNVFINPGVTLGGSVTIGSDTVIGLGANIIDGITIGRHAIIGAGTLVIKDVPDRAVMVGVPARLLRENDPDKLREPRKRRI